MEALSKAKIKLIRSLRLKKNRQREQLFVVEGSKMVQEIIDQWEDSIHLVCSTSESFQANCPFYYVDERTMGEISALSTPSELLAVVRFPKFEPTNASFVLAIDGIQDPGNMGTIIRTADWFGVDKIICSYETVDIYNPKVIQSSMGSLFRVPVYYTDLSNYLEQSELPVYGALLEGESIYDQQLAKACIVVMGNEGNGISSSVQSVIDHPIHIPGKGNAESLNVAVATGVLLATFLK